MTTRMNEKELTFLKLSGGVQCGPSFYDECYEVYLFNLKLMQHTVSVVVKY